MTTSLTPPAVPRTDDGPLDRLLGGMERLGNRLPHPFYLFGGLFAVIAVVSTVLAATGASVTVPGTTDRLAVHGLLTGDGISWLLENALTNFTGFPPLGTVLMMMMAVGVAERTGLLETAVRATIARAPAQALPYVVAFVACQAHVMSDIAILVIPPLAAMAFKEAGRNPIAGLIGSFACVCAGYSAGFTVGSLDALFAGITEKVTASFPAVDDAPTHLLITYYFTASASLLLAFVGGFLTTRVLEPRLPAPVADEAPAKDATSHELTRPQRRGLLFAALAVGAYAAVVVTVWLIPGSPLCGDGGALIESPVLKGIVPLLFLAFLLAGIVHGITAGTITHRDDLPRIMAEAVTSMSGYIVLIFVIAQFIAVFTWSNVGMLVAVKSAAMLKSAGLTGFTAVLLFVLLVAVLNIVITSGSALWSLVAPVFVPTFMLIGMSPALTLAAFRIADSAAHTITPLNPYLFVSLAVLRRYEPDAQLGTFMSRLAIYVLPFMAAWLAVLGVFYVFDLPLGPGAGISIP